VKTLKLRLENCYGIKKLATELDFSHAQAIAVYAPNGSMKTSLAQTFKDIREDADSQDRVFPDRKTIREIADEIGKNLLKENIFVVSPYDEEYGHTEKTSTLLVDSKLRKEYEQLLQQVETSKQVFLENVKKQSGSKKDLEVEISSAFMKTDKQFFEALVRVKDEVTAQATAPFAAIKYDEIFDTKILEFLATKDVCTAIQDYIEKYDRLIAASLYFKRGVFNYYNASTIAKNLADNGFFEAKHTVSLMGKKNKTISSRKELEELVQDEKDSITNDEALRQKFQDIEKLMNKNNDLRTFHAYLLQNQELLPHLANVGKLKEDIWKSYFKAQVDSYIDLVEKYRAAEMRKREIEDSARAQRTQWEEVIEIFNNRFHVPFRLEVSNRTAVVLGQEPIMLLEFVFEDGKDKASVLRDELLRVLSMGEKKALYVLNIIFEVEVRRRANQETLFVVDDVADSFDYKNKYAIVEYLKDISERSYFKQLILTHNFDFYRTICSRFVGYANCLMVTKSETEVSLSQAMGINNPFVNDWKRNFCKDGKKKIACIPFMRNIIEFTKGDQDPTFIKLTSLLHWKHDSKSITQSDLDGVFNAMFDCNEKSANGDKTVMAALGECADECLKAGEGINFENKIVLSIAIRIAAEKFMIEKIKDDEFVGQIAANQTSELFRKYTEKFEDDIPSRTLRRVLLMTPESIHLNSFMYEPILDMSDGHLRTLLADVRALK
jgi:energy-coupling factor transporter ATP-binding protein EcfA2